MMTQLIEFYSSNYLLFILAVSLFSLCVGSLLNVIIYRVPIMLINEWKTHCNELFNEQYETATPCKMNLFYPRSFCPNCKNTVRMWQNIPLFSYFLLGRKCYFCKTPIPFRYPLVEFLTLILSLVIAFKFGVSLIMLCGLLFTWWMLVLAFIDIDHQLLPDSLTLSLLWIGLILNSYDLYVPLQNAVLSACFAYVSLWLFIKIFYLITGKIGMGHGDFKLFAVFGAWFGWQALPFILILSSLLGAIIGFITLKAKEQSTETPIPFGPFLCLSAWIYLIAGTEILQWYWSLYP